MPIIAKAGKSFTPAPEGLHPAVCVDVVDLGMRETPWGEKHKVQIRWQIEERQTDGDFEGQRYLVSQTYTLSIHQKAGLRRDLESWRGKRFTDEEARGFDVERLLGANCQLNIAHNSGNDGTVYANVKAIVPAGRGSAKLEPENYTRQKDRPQEHTNGGGRSRDGKYYDSDEGYHNGPVDDDDEMVPF